MQNVLVNINGQISRWDQAHVSALDRSFLYGDSLYEVVRTAGPEILHLQEHLERLEASAQLCHMTLGQSKSQYAKEIEKTIKAFHQQSGMQKVDAYCRLVVSRGTGKIGFALKNLVTPTTFAIIAMPIVRATPEQLKNGLSMQVVKRLRNDPRALDPALKSGNYLNCLLGYLEATGAGYDDALFCNAEGHVTEGTVFNIGYVKNKIVVTPPLDIGILDGITRRLMLSIAREQNYDVREVRFPKERLHQADEVFLTSTTRDVFPITRVDGKKIGTGKPGPATLHLRALMQKIQGTQ
jgi:branched-chain amino acid aminotransferase